MRATRTLLLGLRLVVLSRWKVALLVVMVAGATLVFLVVAELSRASGDNLDRAIAEDVGVTGTYDVEVASTLGLTRDQMGDVVGAALADVASQPILDIAQSEPATADCPPLEAFGRQQLLVMRQVDGALVRLPYGEGLPSGADLCLQGHRIPTQGVYLASEAEQRAWGSAVVVAPEYLPLVQTSQAAPLDRRYVVVTGEATDMTTTIQETATSALSEAALRHGVVTDELVRVARTDRGAEIRSASDGIRLVYGVIGWGILLLGGLGILAVELTVVRGRTWFFGLARALGASTPQIAALVVLDVLVVVVLGTALAMGVAVAVQPLVEQFTLQAFGIGVRLLQADVVPLLAVGQLLVLAVASTLPAWEAATQDPLDLLEPTI